jgi:molecular chaperone IbpA
MYLTKNTSLFPQTKNWNELIDNLLDGSYSSMNSEKYPATDIYTEGDSTFIEVAVTGFNDSDIEVTLDKGVLTISGTRSTEESNADRSYQYKGIAKRSFTRQFSLSAEIEDVIAKIDKGILYLELIKAPEIDTRKIIQIG